MGLEALAYSALIKKLLEQAKGLLVNPVLGIIKKKQALKVQVHAVKSVGVRRKKVAHGGIRGCGCMGL